MATMLTQFVNHVDQQLQQHMLQEAVALIKGGAPDMETYARRCGEVKGMERAISVMRDVMRQIELGDGDGEPGPLDPPVPAGKPPRRVR